MHTEIAAHMQPNIAANAAQNNQQAPTLQLDMFDAVSEAACYLHPENSGFFSVLVDKGGKRKVQDSFRLDRMPQIVRALPKNLDTWISQAEFFKPNRRVVNLWRLYQFFSDIDCYNHSLSPETALGLLLQACDDNGWPEPSLVLFSGRGIQAKWFLDTPLPSGALPRWNAAQNHLQTCFAEIGADPNARDASRVLRLLGTTNSKSGEAVRVIHITPGQGDKPKLYGSEYLFEHFLPNSRSLYDKKLGNHPFSDEEKTRLVIEREIREAQGRARPSLALVAGTGSQVSNLRKLSGRQLAWDRLSDLRSLFQMREGRVQGYSMPLLFWSVNFMLLSGAANPHSLYHEAAALASEYRFGQLHRGDELGSLYKRAKEFEAGKTVQFGGHEYPALYTPKNATLIELFSITDDEQRKLKTIISKDMAKERDADRDTTRRRAAGAITRSEYRDNAAEKRQKARSMRAAGMSWASIAEAVGYRSADSARFACSKTE